MHYAHINTHTYMYIWIFITCFGLIISFIFIKLLIDLAGSLHCQRKMTLFVKSFIIVFTLTAVLQIFPAFTRSSSSSKSLYSFFIQKNNPLALHVSRERHLRLLFFNPTLNDDNVKNLNFTNLGNERQHT